MLKFFRYALTALFGLGSLVLLWEWNYAPGGVFEAVWTPEEESPFIYDWGPLGSLSYDGKRETLRLNGAKAAFKIKAPFDFSRVEVEAVYEAPKAPEVSLEAASGPWSAPLNTRLLYSEFLENLNGNIRSENGLSVWEKNASGRSLAELASGAHPVKTVGMLAPKNVFGGAGREKTYAVSLRGGHVLWILPGGKGAEINFKIQNMNRNPGPDPIVIEAYGGGKSLKRMELSDQPEADAGPGPLRNIKFSVPDYDKTLEVRFSATDDIFIRELRANASRMVFENRIFLGDSVGYGGASSIPLLWTDSGSVRARTPHKESKQTIYFAGRGLRLDLSGEDYYLKLNGNPGGLLPIRLEHDDVEIGVSGFLALSPEDFFNPAWPRIYWDSSREPGETVLARYEPVKRSGGALVSRTVFDAKDLYRESDGGYRLFLSLSGSGEEELSIKRISIKALR